MNRYRVRPTKTASIIALLVAPAMLVLAWPSLGYYGGFAILFIAVLVAVIVLNAINLFAPGGVSWPFSNAFYGYDIVEDPDGDSSE